MRRRECLRLMAGAVLLPGLRAFEGFAEGPLDATLSKADEAFLEEMERAGCLYFVEQASPANGQVLDRAAAFPTDGKRDGRVMASIAATGFGLTALCISERRGFQTRAMVLDRVRRTLRYHLEVLRQDHGFLYHFNDIETGLPYRNTEVSPIDTSLFLCGVLTARAHFHEDAAIVGLATKLYERVDWPWMLNGGTTFAMGVRDGKFIDARWNHFCELMMLYLLAMGSPTHPIPASSWEAWTRPVTKYAGFTFIGGGDPIFVHQYSHAWYDFRGKRDQYANYFTNSVTATKAHEAFCLSLGKPYSVDYWGISASDSQHGYVAWGGPGKGPRGFGGIDGSVVPNATAGSLPFLPAACMRVQRSLKEKYGEEAWGRYGFCDAFHPQVGWYDPDVLGIDLGISVVMAENLRSGFVWETFGRNTEVGVAMKRAGFHAT